MGKTSKIKKTDLRRVIRATGGNVSQVARSFVRVDEKGNETHYSRQAIYDLVEKYELWDELNKYRNRVHLLAEDNIYNEVEKGDKEASFFVKRYAPAGTQTQKWTNTTEIVGAVKLSPEVLKLLDEMGIEPDDVASEFETLIQQIHAESVNANGE